MQGFQAQDKAAQAYAHALGLVDKAQAGGNASQIANAQSGLAALVKNQQNAATNAAVTGAGIAAAGAIGFVNAEINAVKEAISVYEDYANQIRTIQQLTGASVGQSQSFVNLSKVAGVSDVGQIKEAIALIKDAQSGTGRNALARLGVTPGENDLDTLQQVIGAFSKMKDGVHKTGLELEIFKAKGVQTLQPLLNLQGDIVAKTAEYSAGLDDGAIQSILHLQQNVRALGLEFMNYIVIPIAQQVVPVLEWLVDTAEGVINVFHKFDEATHGLGSISIIIAGIGTGMLAIVAAGAKVYEAIKAITEIEAVENTILAVKAALTGQWQNLAIAGGVLAVGAGATYYLHNQSNPADAAGEKISGAADTIKGAADTFAGAVNNIKTWGNAAGSQLPSNFSEADYAFAKQKQALGATR